MSSYDMIASTNDNTVVLEYENVKTKRKEYQSEAELEKSFIEDLIKQGYEYLKIHNEQDLILNLRRQLEKLNGFSFSDKEWDTFFITVLANKKDGIKEKTKKIQRDYVQVLERDDGSFKNVYLIDKKNVHNNYLQVINQYVVKEGNYQVRYDVTILVNGLPLVHVELKRRGVSLVEAFNQINRYQKDSFWAASGLYEYVQIFVISNGTRTKYYSNSARDAHVQKNNHDNKPNKKASDSFKFTMYWADAKNKVIWDLADFTKTFFARHTILNILTKYCVFTVNEVLLVMRPYQIVATEKIINKIQLATYYKKQGTIEAGGYIWHTTGSGKTLTSFKTAQLVSEMTEIDKVLFVVDRKDLDNQTIAEYNSFEEGSADSNENTKVLTRQLENRNENGGYHNYKIIVTTIQKLNNFVMKNPGHEVMKKNIVFIFDECHRSQFGKMHTRIIKNFKKYYIFGFTGTPICVENANGKFKYDKEPVYQKRSQAEQLSKYVTTEQLFGENLHTYSIIDAIRDENVLPFRIDYVGKMKLPDTMKDSKIYDIDREAAYHDKKRMDLITDYILQHFDQKTRRNKSYSYKGKHKKGFNSIFAVDSIPSAMMYYKELKKKIHERGLDYKMAIIFSFNPNQDDPDDFFLEEEFETDKLDMSYRDFLSEAINDYNILFGQNFDTSNKGFSNYYTNLSDKMKNQDIDLLIVVNMFLTGFDAPTLNTLWVDKNLKYHGLLQAFSRTNRILNNVKTYGNIICFRNLKQATEDALALFSEEKNASRIVLMKSFEEYYEGYTDENGKNHKGYKELIHSLYHDFPIEGFHEMGETKEKTFIGLYGAILKLNNILVSFDEFFGKEIISPGELQDYQEEYLRLYDKYRPQDKTEKENINDDIVFEMELVKQVDVNIDYILELIKKKKEENSSEAELEVTIRKIIDSSLQLRSKKELIMTFIQTCSIQSDVNGDWQKYIQKRMDEELNGIIDEERLKKEETKAFMDECFDDGFVKEYGRDIDKILPPISRIGGKRESAKKRIVVKLKEFFEKYYDVC